MLVIAFTCVLVLTAGCSDDDEDRALTESVDPPTSGGDAATGSGGGSGQLDARIAATCDRLQDLAVAVLNIHDAESLDEVNTAVEEPLGNFTEAAAASGDDQLAAIAAAASEEYSAYMATGISDAFDATLDQAGGRCQDLGAPDEFPLEP